MNLIPAACRPDPTTKILTHTYPEVSKHDLQAMKAEIGSVQLDRRILILEVKETKVGSKYSVKVVGMKVGIKMI